MNLKTLLFKHGAANSLKKIKDSYGTIDVKFSELAEDFQYNILMHLVKSVLDHNDINKKHENYNQIAQGVMNNVFEQFENEINYTEIDNHISDLKYGS